MTPNSLGPVINSTSWISSRQLENHSTFQYLKQKAYSHTTALFTQPNSSSSPIVLFRECHSCLLLSRHWVQNQYRLQGVKTSSRPCLHIRSTLAPTPFPTPTWSVNSAASMHLADQKLVQLYRLVWKQMTKVPLPFPPSTPQKKTQLVVSLPQKSIVQ